MPQHMYYDCAGATIFAGTASTIGRIWFMYEFNFSINWRKVLLLFRLNDKFWGEATVAHEFWNIGRGATIWYSAQSIIKVAHEAEYSAGRIHNIRCKLQRTRCTEILLHIFRFLKELWHEKYANDAGTPKEVSLNVPQQPNSYECGIYMILFVDAFVQVS